MGRSGAHRMKIYASKAPVGAIIKSQTASNYVADTWYLICDRDESHLLVKQIPYPYLHSLQNPGHIHVPHQPFWIDTCDHWQENIPEFKMERIA